MTEDFLRKLIRKILNEDLGKIKGRGLKGYGASHPYYVNSKRPSLGKTNTDCNDSIEKERGLVKVSRAFKKEQI